MGRLHRGEFSRYQVDLAAHDQVIEMIDQSPLDTKIIWKHVDTPTFDEWRERFDPEFRERVIPE